MIASALVRFYYVRFRLNKSALYKISYGLYVLGSKDGDKLNGCMVNTVGQVTDSPLRVSVAVNKLNYSHDLIKKTGAFSVSMLSTKATFDTIKCFGFQSGKTADKFAGRDYSLTESGLPYLNSAEANSYLDCRVVNTLDMGSHSVFYADVLNAEVLSNDDSLTYDYYQKNVKPKPSVAPAKPKVVKKTVWRCSVCDYEYEGDELPEDYVCPICGVGAENFVREEIEVAVEPESGDELEKRVDNATGRVQWVCRICGYVYEGEELPPDYICPICKHGADAFDKVVVGAAE